MSTKCVYICVEHSSLNITTLAKPLLRKGEAVMQNGCHEMRG